LGSNSRQCELFLPEDSAKQSHARIVNQIAAMTIATTIAPHIAGVTFFELPLRGESLAAWLNSRFIGGPAKRHRFPI
jgi:hypothetical protein